jgi:hypothetical protein
MSYILRKSRDLIIVFRNKRGEDEPSLVLCKFAIFCFIRDFTISSRLSQDFVSVWICVYSIFLTEVSKSIRWNTRRNISFDIYKASTWMMGIRNAKIVNRSNTVFSNSLNFSWDLSEQSKLVTQTEKAGILADNL